MKIFLIILFLYSSNLRCDQNEDFNKYKKIMLEKCLNGNSESCKSMGTLIEIKSNKYKIYTIACAEDISDACYKLAKEKNESIKVDNELNTLISETKNKSCDTNILFVPIKGRYGLNPTLSLSHGSGATSLGLGISTEAFIIDQFSMLARFSLAYTRLSTASTTSFNLLAGFRGYVMEKGTILPFFQIGGGVYHITNITAGVFSPGLGLLIPINNSLTVNIEIDPALFFNSGTSFLINTTIGVEFWF